MEIKKQVYNGVTTVDYMPLKNHLVLEGKNKEESKIKLPDTVTFDSGLFHHWVVVAYGPDLDGRGLNIGDWAYVDPRMKQMGAPIDLETVLEDEQYKDRFFAEFEFNAVRGLIPAREETDS